MSLVGYEFDTDKGFHCTIVSESKEYIGFNAVDTLAAEEFQKAVCWSVPKKLFHAVTGHQLFLHKSFEQKEQIKGNQLSLF